MTSIAEGLFTAGLARTPSYLFFFLYFHKDWAHAGRAVATVAKRLFLGLAAGTPDVFAWFDALNDR